MHIALRAATITLSALVVAGLIPTVRASARSGEPDVLDRPVRATAEVRGLQLEVFGSPVELGSSAATIKGSVTAEARAVGTGGEKETLAAAEVDELNQRKRNAACVPRLALFEVLDVQMTCAESRVQALPPLFADGAPTHTGAALFEPSERVRDSNPKPIDNGGPQAVGRGPEVRVGIGRTSLLEPHLVQLRTLLDVLSPMSEQTVIAVSERIPPSSGAVLTSLAGSFGLRHTDAVGPVVMLLDQLVNGLQKATALATIKVDPSSTHANSDAQKVVALAQAGGGQIDVLPGVAPGGAPLYSIAIGPGRSSSSFNRATTVGTPAYEPAATTMRLGLRLLGANVGEVTVEPEVPVTLLAGTPLETTISTGRGRTVENKDGSVGSFVDGVSVQTLKGVNGGIAIRLGYAESLLGGPEPVAKPGNTDRRLWFLAAGVSLGATLLLLGYTVARRRVAGEPRTLPQLGS